MTYIMVTPIMVTSTVVTSTVKNGLTDKARSIVIMMWSNWVDFGCDYNSDDDDNADAVNGNDDDDSDNTTGP